MKRTFLLLMVALAFVACEQKKQVAQNPKISFEYREVVDSVVGGIQAIDIRSTSEPEYIAPDLWYYYGTEIAEQIGDGHHRFPAIGTYNVVVLYKPGVEPDLDAVHASKNFTITITGVADSIWRDATPVE